MNRVLLLVVLSLAPGADARGQELIPARLSLEQALGLAIERNPTLAAARETLHMAAADRITAGLRPNPALSVESAGYPLFESSGASFNDNQELTVRFDQEIELAGRRRLRIQAADEGATAAEAAFRDQRRRLEFDVRRSYFTVVLAKTELEVARAALAEIDNVIALNQARYQQGEISGGDVRRIQVERLKFVDDEFASELGLRNARSELLALMNAPDFGVEFDVVETLASAATGRVGQTPGGTTPTIDAAILRTQALAVRPDLIAARQQVQRADTESRLQRALRTPNITVGGGYRRDFGTDGVVFGVTVPLPLFNGNQGAVARADAERRQAASLATATAAEVLLDVQHAINAVDVNRARVAYIEREYLTPSQESRDIVLASYRLGSANLIDFLDAQRAFRDTLRTYNRALYEQRISLFRLAAATGGDMATVTR